MEDLNLFNTRRRLLLAALEIGGRNKAAKKLGVSPRTVNRWEIIFGIRNKNEKAGRPQVK